MKKMMRLAAAVLAAVSVLSMTVQAGEFIDQGNGRIYYDTGEAFDYSGWHWIMRTDGLARCYYFSNGYVWQNTRTPDGCQVDDTGAWIENGQVMTKSTYEAGMGRETNWWNFGGEYSIRQLQYEDGTFDNYIPGEWPIRVDGEQNGIWLVWTGSDGSRQWFTSEGYMYSYICTDGTLLDVIDENNFRILWPGGAVYYVSR